MDFPKRNEIWIVNLNPTIGAEIKKTRPALIISNNINNQYAKIVTVLPITDKGKKVYPFEVVLSPKGSGLSKESKVKCQQIRTVDKRRLVKSLGMITQEKMDQAERATTIHLGIDFK